MPGFASSGRSQGSDRRDGETVRDSVPSTGDQSSHQFAEPSNRSVLLASLRLGLSATGVPIEADQPTSVLLTEAVEDATQESREGTAHARQQQQEMAHRQQLHVSGL